uniref:beta-4C adrenergic receptor-like n=1 Tax=Myxine glutinosa TaxID=7769 RepID=UPI00358E8B88
MNISNSTRSNLLFQPSSIVLATFLFLLAFVTTVGNVIVLLAIVRAKHSMSTISKIFISSLACADLITACDKDPSCCDFISSKSYAVVGVTIAFYIPLAVMIFVYSRVLKEAELQAQRSILNEKRPDVTEGKRGQISEQQNSKNHRARKALGLVMGVFTICWTPFMIMFPIRCFCITCVSNDALLLINWFGFINSTLNPLLYSRSPDFMEAYKKLFSCKTHHSSHSKTIQTSQIKIAERNI